MRAIDRLAAELSPTRTLVYKRSRTAPLSMHIFEPVGHKRGDARPCFLAIHGGGWMRGSPRVYYPFAENFARLGMVGISLEYSLMSTPGVTPFDCVKDGRSAMRFLKAHATELGIDPQKIIAAGGSAGAHVAAGTALFEGVDDEGDDRNIPCEPAALVLYYPVIDTSSEGYGQKKCGERWSEISPLHRVKPHAPPTLILHGTGDTTTPYRGAELFRDTMRSHGNHCELITHRNGVHGYFIYEVALFNEAMAKTQAFLTSINL
jgi:acetyl esterase/lipase